MKIGYVASRAGLISTKEQVALLIDDGVPENFIYTIEHGIGEAIKACDRGDDILVVHSAIVIGGHAYPRVIKELADRNAKLLVLRKSLLIDCVAGEGVADGAMDIKHHQATIGAVKGRKRNITPEQAQKIIDYVTEGNSQKEAAVTYGTNSTLVSRIINGTYFAYEGKE